MSKILLTGASGFIGRNIAGHLLQSGHEIIAPLRPGALDKIPELASHAMFSAETGLFYEDKLLAQLSDKPIECIIHLAAIRGAGSGGEALYREVNIAGTQKLLEFARANHVRYFLYVSTVGVHGTIPEPQPATAGQPANPDNAYHRSKWQGEELVRRFQNPALRTVILRPTITYGPYDDGFLPKLIRMTLQGNFFFPLKDIYLHLLNVKALAQLIENIINKKLFTGDAYIVADQRPLLLKDLVDQIYQIGFTKNYPKYRQLPTIAFDTGTFMSKILGLNGLHTSLQLITRSWMYDIEKTKNDLDFNPFNTIETINDVIGKHIYENR